MGVSGIINRIAYAGNGATTAFSFPYYCFAKADVNVALYVTATGAVTPQVFTTNYTIATVADAQGVYGSGLTITMNVAPPAGTTVVIYRAPSQVQNYALLQNGILSSLSTVQQLDYLTLLVQRLADLTTRSVRLNDGTAPTFDPTIPSAAPINPGAYLVVNAAGNGIDFATNTGVRKSIGSKSVPQVITALGGIAWTAVANVQTWYVVGSGGPVTVTANPPIAAGTVVGQELRIVGTDDTNFVLFDNATGLSINGEIALQADDCIDLEWDGTNWRETSRS